MLTSRSTLSVPAGLLLGYALDRLLGDPRRRHPVAGFGRAAGWLEARLYADRRARGVAYVVVLVGAAGGLGVLLDRVSRAHPLQHAAVTAAATWTVLGGRSLERAAQTVANRLAADDLAAAVAEFQARERRFGGVGPSAVSAA